MGLVLLTSQAWATDAVVVEARGTALKAGQVIDDTQKLTLQRGDEVTLVAADGSIIKLRGPYDAPPGAANSGVDVSNALAALGSGQSRAAMGVVRAKTDDVDLPDPWLVDVTHSGKACVRPGSTVVFWRPQAAAATKLKVTPADRTWRAEAEWTAGASQLPAPTIFPMTDRQTYVFDIGGQQSNVTLVQVPTSLTTDRMRAAWMLQKKCLAQTKALILTMK
jgi:hypothetical protein